MTVSHQLLLLLVEHDELENDGEFLWDCIVHRSVGHDGNDALFPPIRKLRFVRDQCIAVDHGMIQMGGNWFGWVGLDGRGGGMRETV